MNKRKNDLIQLAILAALGAAVILTLAVPQLSLVGRERRPTEVSVVIRESDSALWANARQGMEQAASELGAELRFLTLTPDNQTGGGLPVRSPVLLSAAGGGERSRRTGDSAR